MSVIPLPTMIADGGRRHRGREIVFIEMMIQVFSLKPTATARLEKLLFYFQSYNFECIVIE